MFSCDWLTIVRRLQLSCINYSICKLALKRTLNEDWVLILLSNCKSSQSPFFLNFWRYGTETIVQQVRLLSSGGGSVGRAVASDTRDLGFKARHWQNFIYQFVQLKIEEMKIKEKRPGMTHLKKTSLSRRQNYSVGETRRLVIDYVTREPSKQTKTNLVCFPLARIRRFWLWST